MTWNQAAEQFVDELASSNPTPGGGAAAAMTGAMGCSLLIMAIGTTLKRKATPAQSRTLLLSVEKNLRNLHMQLKNLITKDAQAYDAYLTASKLPKEDTSRPHALQESLWLAACVPADTAKACIQVLKQLNECEAHIASIIISDVYCAKHLLTGAIQCCRENIQVNMKQLTHPDRVNILQEQLTILSAVQSL